MTHTRRDFLADVGKGMVVASIGSSLAADIGVGWADEAPAALNFGNLETLVCLMQETPVARLMPVLVERLQKGTELRQLVAAGALANARTFGGEDYIGYHSMMAIGPAYHMSAEMPQNQRALPILKVLYRNSSRIQARGGRRNEVLRPVEPSTLPEGRVGGEVLREQVRRREVANSERTFAALARGTPDETFNHLLFAVHDAAEVHRTVLPYRSWDLLNVIGREHAHTLLRQSVRYCINEENPRYAERFASPRNLLPRLLEEHRLLGRERGTRTAEDAWVERLSQTFFQSTPEQAAGAAASALAEGFVPDAIGEAITLAANQLILRDPGTAANQANANFPAGSVHGASIGVHGCDSANAWRNIARASNPRNTMASLILGAWQVAFDRGNRVDLLNRQPYPLAEARERVTSREADVLLRETEEAIRGKDQARACAVVHRYGELGHAPRGMFDLLLRFAVSEDGSLHAEKFYRTVSEEFAATRAAFRWRHVVALARVTTSAFGQAAPGVVEARRLLKI